MIKYLNLVSIRLAELIGRYYKRKEKKDGGWEDVCQKTQYGNCGGLFNLLDKPGCHLSVIAFNFVSQARPFKHGLLRPAALRDKCAILCGCSVMTIRFLHLLHYLYFHVLKWTGLFLNEHKTEQESLVFVKRMMAVAVSSITYLRGIFPEDAYRSRYLEGETRQQHHCDGELTFHVRYYSFFSSILPDLCIKVLREECSNSGANKIVKW